MIYQGITDEKNALEAVKNDGNALQYVTHQTDAVCLEAVKYNGNALQYVLSFEILRNFIACVD